MNEEGIRDADWTTRPRYLHWALIAAGNPRGSENYEIG